MSLLERGATLGRAGGSSQRKVTVLMATGGQHDAFPAAPGRAALLHGVPAVISGTTVILGSFLLL